MSGKASHRSKVIRLHRITPGRPIAAYEVREETFTPFARERPVTAPEIIRMIDHLLEQLSEPQRRALYGKISAARMI